MSEGNELWQYNGRPIKRNESFVRRYYACLLVRLMVCKIGLPFDLKNLIYFLSYSTDTENIS